MVIILYRRSLMTSEVAELKARIRVGQRRLALIEEKQKGAQGEEANKLFEDLSKVIDKITSLCARLKELIGPQNTCVWGCSLCLDFDEPPLEKFENQGYLLFYSSVLNDLVAFAKDEARDKVPPHYIVYTESEIKLLFAIDSEVTPQNLRLIHAAKRYGAIITERTVVNTFKQGVLPL
jgi:hypothetical protein